MEGLAPNSKRPRVMLYPMKLEVCWGGKPNEVQTIEAEKHVSMGPGGAVHGRVHSTCGLIKGCAGAARPNEVQTNEAEKHVSMGPGVGVGGGGAVHERVHSAGLSKGCAGVASPTRCRRSRQIEAD